MRYLRTKFADDPTEPVQLTARGIGQSMAFWSFSAKKVMTSSDDVTFFSTSKGLKVSSCDQAQSCQFWCRGKKGFRISKKIFTGRLQKNFFLAIIF